MKRCADTCVFGPELGARLRSLRKRAGLTQGQLMALAGRSGKGAAYLASRLEQGKVPYPSFGLIVDYLRGCRASFMELHDLLYPLTMRPLVMETRPAGQLRQTVASLGPEVRGRVLSVAVRSALAAPIPDEQQPVRTDTPEERQARLVAFRSAVQSEQTIEEALTVLIESHGWSLAPRQRQWLVETARSICRAFVRWPNRRLRRARRRAERAVAVGAKKGIDPALIQTLELELALALDPLCELKSFARTPAFESLTRPTRRQAAQSEYKARLTEYETAYGGVVYRVFQAVQAVLAPLAGDTDPSRWESFQHTVKSIACDRDLKPEQRRARIAELARTTKHPQEVIRAGDEGMAAWERRRILIPPQPDPPRKS